MTFWRVLLVATVSTCWLIVSIVADAAPTNSSSSSNIITRNAKHVAVNSSQGNSSLGKNELPKSFGVDGSMIQRALYVLIGITIIGVLYFLIRAVRLKKPAQRKKYGLLSNYDDSVEMEAVESEEDDTLYEARSLRR